jgi:hypothetical protein
VGEEVFIRLLRRLAPEHAFPDPDKFPTVAAGQLFHVRAEALHSIPFPDQVAYRVFKLAPKWPSITAGGPRFLHPSRAFLVKNWKLLHQVDKRFWLGYDPNRAVLVMFGHSLEEASVHPKNPVHQPGILPLPGIPYVPRILPSDVKPETLRNHRNPAGLYATLLEYMVIYPDLGRSVMQRIETDHKFKTSLLGIYKAVGRLTELREVLKVYNLSPELPPTWKESPYMIRFNTVKQARMAAYVETLERAMRDKMRKELDRDESYSEENKRIREEVRQAQAQGKLNLGASSQEEEPAIGDDPFEERVVRMVDLDEEEEDVALEDIILKLAEDELFSDEEEGPPRLPANTATSYMPAVEDISDEEMEVIKAPVTAEEIDEAAHQFSESVTLEQREEEMEVKVHDNGTTNRELGGAARQSGPHEHRFTYNTDYVFADLRPLGSSLPMLAPQVHETNWDVLRRLPNEEIVRIEDVALQQKDFARLASGRWFNDNLLDGYLKLIAIGTNHLHPRDQIRVMPSYFFTTLEKIGYDNVRSYTRKENIFTYRYVYVPVNFANKHWGLTVVDVRMGRMIYLDSVSSGRESRAASVFSKLADYFHTEHVANPRCAGTSRPIFRTRVSQSMPLQENGSDCGLFLCVAADYIAKGKNTDFSQKDMRYFRQRVHYELIVGARFND